MATELRVDCITGETEEIEYTPAAIVEPQPTAIVQLAAALGITETTLADAIAQIAGP